MNLTTHQKRLLISLVGSPEMWAEWPFLYLQRMRDGRMEDGLMIDLFHFSSGRSWQDFIFPRVRRWEFTGYSATVFDRIRTPVVPVQDLTRMLDDLPKQVYDTAKEIVDAGWYPVMSF